MKAVIFVRSQHNYDTNEASDQSGLKCEDPSLTVQDERDEVDINTIVQRFGLAGKLPEGVRTPVYGDFTGLRTYHDAANAIAMANESFETMPAHVRERFNNDPGAFVDFCSNDANRAEATKLGLTPPDKTTSALAGSPKEPPKAQPVDSTGKS